MMEMAPPVAAAAQAYAAPPQEAYRLKPHVRRLLDKSLSVVPENAAVVVEGPPVYLNAEWYDQMEFGYNGALAEAVEELTGKGCGISHYALYDEYSEPPTIDPSHYTSRFRVRPEKIIMESELLPEAEAAAEKISGKYLHRYDGRLIALRRQNGKVACCLMDAVFQRQKVGEASVIIHPYEWKLQQEEMRVVLREICGGELPYEILNIFLKGGTINKTFHTDRSGRTIPMNLH